MKKRDQILHLIRIEAALYGEITRTALRLFIESRISRSAFDEAISQGMRQFAAKVA